MAVARYRSICSAAMDFVKVRKSRYTSSRLIMGIESSCDDTGMREFFNVAHAESKLAVAIVASDRSILSQAIYHQDVIHRPWKGVVPYLAAQGHKEVIDSVIEHCLTEAKIGIKDLSAIAVTRGPGLSICLGIGVDKAKELCIKHGTPLMGINHMEGHALTPRFFEQKLEFPYLALLISGGHTQLLLVRGVGEYNLIGNTLDIAVGDAFDKAARKLNLSCFNGGKELERAANYGDPNQYHLPSPLKKHKNCDFSFSGLQTAFNMTVDSMDETTLQNSQVIYDLASSFQKSILNHLIDRTKRAILWVKQNEPRARVLIVAGGVACNESIKSEMKNLVKKFGWKCIIPSAELCTDNGVMISWAGHENWNSGKKFQDPYDFYYIPKWPLDKSGIEYFPLVQSQRAIKATRGLKQIEKYNSELTASPSPDLFYKACMASIGLKDFEQAHKFATKGLDIFPNSEILSGLIDKIRIKQRLHQMRFT